jgi:hypothetical protein
VPEPRPVWQRIPSIVHNRSAPIKSRVRNGDLGPSFNRKVETGLRVAELAASLLGIHRHQLSAFDNKAQIPGIADAAGVPIPRRIYDAVHYVDIGWSKLPSAVVIKPVWGAGTAGVRVLTRDNSGWDSGWFEALSGRIWTTRELVQSHESLIQEGLVSRDLIIEEKVGSGAEPPPDWKFFTFQGEVELVQESVQTGGTRFCFYDLEWRRLKKVHYLKVSDWSLPGPVFPERLLDAARKVSIAVPLPFVRVDLYEQDGRVLLGELTPYPGQRMFRPTWDLKLGRAWEMAEARLLAGRYDAA